MPGAEGEAGRRYAPGVLVAMLSGVPALRGHVDAPAEGDTVVDHHDLRVVGAARRMSAIELQVQSAVRGQVQERQGKLRATEPAEIPLQEKHVEIRLCARQPAEERLEGVGTIHRPARRFELDPRVDIPPDQIKGMLRLQHRLLYRDEIGFGVHDHAQSVGLCQSRARRSRYQHGSPL